MGDSLQEQLLRAGLVNRDKLKQSNAEKRKKFKQKNKRRADPVDQERLDAQRAWAEKEKMDRELNRQREQQAKRKAMTAQIRQLIATHKISRADGELPYNFVDGRKLKKIWVTAELQRQLSNGMLAIVKQGDAYELLPAEIAEKIRQRDEKRVLLCNKPEQASGGEDEFYADYKIPDDLMW